METHCPIMIYDHYLPNRQLGYQVPNQLVQTYLTLSSAVQLFSHCLLKRNSEKSLPSLLKLHQFLVQLFLDCTQNTKFHVFKYQYNYPKANLESLVQQWIGGRLYNKLADFVLVCTLPKSLAVFGGIKLTKTNYHLNTTYVVTQVRAYIISNSKSTSNMLYVVQNTIYLLIKVALILIILVLLI